MTSFPVSVHADAAAAVKDCATLRIENGWSRTEYRECRRGEIQANIDRLDAEFNQMRDWLRARGLDVNEEGHITDPKGRTLAQIEASNAALAASNADLAASNAALRADITALELSIQTSKQEYLDILKEFERSVLKGL
ncbi:MAG: hypothetical protein AAF429_03605 [Pseudomonadota bacterium]